MAFLKATIGSPPSTIITAGGLCTGTGGKKGSGGGRGPGGATGSAGFG